MPLQRRRQGIAYKLFLSFGSVLEPYFPYLAAHLRRAEVAMLPREFIARCVMITVFSFFGVFAWCALLLYRAGNGHFLLYSMLAAAFISLFLFFQQVAYPKLLIAKRAKLIERSLLAALQNMLVQLNSGVPLFQIMVNLSHAGYGEVSKEFGKAVRDIGTGKEQAEVLEDLAVNNPSLFFRRAIWQIVNGIKSGADLTSVIKESIHALSEEQIIQIQKYGSTLNPLAMFYMLVAVIIPSLGITFLIIFLAFLGLPGLLMKGVFWVFYAGILFFQIMFLGIIKSRRPNLMAGD